MNKSIVWQRYAKGLFVIVMIMTIVACQNENHHTLANSAINTKTTISPDNFPPLLLSTIKPVHLLVAAIAGEQFTLQQLIPDGASPHHYALRPSDRRAIADAQLVFRIHADLETFLNPLLAQQANRQTITLAQAAGVVLQPLDNSKNNIIDTDTHHAYEHIHEQGSHQHGQETSDDNHAKHDTNHQYDLHLWLDPPQAIAMSRMIAAQLQQIDQANAALYQQRLTQLIADIQQADKDIQAQLVGIRQQAYLVQHDAWQSFERRYQLNKIAAIEGLSGQQAGAASLKQIIKRIQQDNIRCLFTESSLITGQVQTLQQATQIKLALLDPLGVILKIAPQIPAYSDSTISVSARLAYLQLLKNAADQFTQCLAAP
jgi:zinc transport system substrate-binding protein